ncbi:serine hydrolase domain-containing protein [Rubrivivax albus]|uniref:Class A beta-lactamase-related serine hydrolase n=1 Tax=Rubrivivax albus TaxID=2499835 RepID=A0A437K0F7_9BURK|nr:serine hydrolase domain-containing protein [Rubrivivax albus]RVT53743.1 class A beta-lactamase-related serine hydrolase [Rubrivivax albus]
MGAARALMLASALVAGCAGPAGGGRPDDAGLAPQADALLSEALAVQPFSGALVMMRDGRVVHAQGWGLADRGSGVPFTPETPSDGGSLAKTFTAASVWWLVHEGRLALASPVRHLVPEYPHDCVTVAHLLAHSAGLAPDYAGFDRHFHPGQARSTAALLQLAGRDAPEPAFAPGTGFAYSDLGYDALALAVERASGQPYADFVRERFFRPHGLVHSFVRPVRLADWPVPRTRGYRWRDGRWEDHDAYDDEAFVGGSNLVFSAGDLARWGQAWALGGALPAAAETPARQRPRIAGRVSALDGLHWWCDDGGTRCHFIGALNGFHALVFWDRARRESVGLVTNTELPPWTLFTLERGLVDRLAGREPPATERWAALLATRHDAADVAAAVRSTGCFRLPDGRQVTLIRDGAALQLQIDDQPPEGLEHVAGRVYRRPADESWVAMEAGSTGLGRLHLRSLYDDLTATAAAPCATGTPTGRPPA